jgi:hypothetical protein
MADRTVRAGLALQCCVARLYPAVLIHSSSMLRRFIASWRETASFNLATETLISFDSQ